MKLKIPAILLGIAMAVTGFSSTYYVSTTGNDSNTGTSLSAPWKTVRKGLTSLRAGDTLYVRGGTYQEVLGSSTPVRIYQGTSTARITFRNYGKEKPIIKGLLWLNRPSYWTISGINVTWLDGQSSKSHMVKLNGGVNWTFTKGEVWGAKSYAGILVSSTYANEPNNWKISYSSVHDIYKSNDTNQDHAIYCNTGLTAKKGVIERNLFYNVANGNGVKVAGHDPGYGSSNVTVRYNTIYNCTQGVLIGWASYNTMVYRNIIGKVGTNYGCIRGYDLTGTNNVAYQNVGFLAKTMILNWNAGLGVTDGGENKFPVDPHVRQSSNWRL